MTVGGTEPSSPSAASGGVPVPVGASPAVPGRSGGGTALARRIVRFRWVGRAFRWGTTVVAAAIAALVVAIAALLANESERSFHRFGSGFLTGPHWYLATGQFGAGPAIYGTLLTSGLALLFAVPVALGVALFTAELAPRWLRPVLAYVVDLGAMVPSVVYGIWGLLVLVPFMTRHVEPALLRLHAPYGIFSGLPAGLGVLTAGLILAVMIVPTVAALSREALRAVPAGRREAALALGATRWEASRMAILGPARNGILGGVVLGLGRALGETIAVVLVIGNIYQYPKSLLAPGVTIPSWLVNYFGSAGGLQLSALYELGLVLLGMSLAINIGARLLLARAADETRVGWGRRRGRLVRRTGSARSAESAPGSVPFGPRPLRRLWRQFVFLLVWVLGLAAVVVAVYPLASLLRLAISQGGSVVVRPSFYTSPIPPACLNICSLGGIGPAIEGTFLVVGLAALIGIPLGLLAGIYLSEYGRNRFGRGVGVVIDALIGLPSLLVGVFVFALILRYDRTMVNSLIAGAIALAIIMLPFVVRTTETALGTVSRSVRESALALGFPRHRITLRVVLGSCRSAIVTGCLLAVGRAAGETAALLFTLGWSSFGFTGWNRSIASLAPFIYEALSLGYPNWIADAWGATLVLLLIMLGVTLAARLALRTEDVSGAE